MGNKKGNTLSDFMLTILQHRRNDPLPWKPQIKIQPGWNRFSK